MDKATKRLRQFEDARAPQELPDDPVTDLNQSVNEEPVGEKEVANKVQQRHNRLAKDEKTKS